MQLQLSSTTEAALQTLAARRGKAPEDIVDALVQQAAREERELQDAAAGIQAGLDDFAAGRWVSLEDIESRPLSGEHAA